MGQRRNARTGGNRRSPRKPQRPAALSDIPTCENRARFAMMEEQLDSNFRFEEAENSADIASPNHTNVRSSGTFTNCKPPQLPGGFSGDGPQQKNRAPQKFGGVFQPSSTHNRQTNFHKFYNDLVAYTVPDKRVQRPAEQGGQLPVCLQPTPATWRARSDRAHSPWKDATSIKSAINPRKGLQRAAKSSIVLDNNANVCIMNVYLHCIRHRIESVKGPACLHRFSSRLAEKRGSYKGHAGTRYKGAIAATRRVMKRRVGVLGAIETCASTLHSHRLYAQSTELVCSLAIDNAPLPDFQQRGAGIVVLKSHVAEARQTKTHASNRLHVRHASTLMSSVQPGRRVCWNGARERVGSPGGERQDCSRRRRKADYVTAPSLKTGTSWFPQRASSPSPSLSLSTLLSRRGRQRERERERGWNGSATVCKSGGIVLRDSHVCKSHSATPHPHPRSWIEPSSPWSEASAVPTVHTVFIWSRGDVVVIFLTSHLGEPGSIPGGVTPPRIFAYANRAGRCRWSAGFLGDFLFYPGAAPYSPRFTLIGSQDLEVERGKVQGETEERKRRKGCEGQTNKVRIRGASIGEDYELGTLVYFGN
ncbi:hypothetical protein PR048_000219 [Dryococelus australis]|uniref:Uncharacterized protein n=1 Tax=Dryococelus australis TaxID=614101 RepID=A0ABQ9IE01_9NEOP|nr:hypothetical protein PR048_000219 [Dryococelus australis]